MSMVVNHLSQSLEGQLSNRLPVVRWGGLITLLIGELLLLTVTFDSETLTSHSVLWAKLFGSAHLLPQLAIVVVTAAFIFGGEALQTGLQKWGQLAGESHHWRRWGAANLIAFAALVPTTAVVFEVRLPYAVAQESLAVTWVVLVLIAGFCWCCAVLPLTAWIELLNQHRLPLVGVLVIGTLALFAGRLSDRLWLPLGQSTVWLTSSLLGLFVEKVITGTTDASMETPGLPIIGTPEFDVWIKPECSGYEGMGMAAVFVGTYLWFSRRELRWPQAWFLLPVAIVLMWLLNGLRIAALILIGSSGWPEIALGGFHSQAGLLAFNVVVLGLVACSRRSRWFLLDTDDDSALRVSNPTAAYLLPLVALLGSIMITTAFSGRFDWLYPVRVFAVGATLLFFCRSYAAWNWSWSWGAVGLGVLVFGLWLGFEYFPGSTARTSALGSDLASLPRGWAACWLVFRVLGSVLIAPFAEELAFRGYLMRRLLHPDFEKVPATQFSWFALFVSSALFGVLHPGRWLAGTLAGLLYGLAVYRRGNVLDAVLAHATTNALIVLYVLTTGSWTLWS